MTDPALRPARDRRSRRWLRWLGWSLAALALLLVLAGSAGWLWLRTSLPQIDGTLRVAGLEAPVTVVRDRWAIPHIEAQSARDAMFALGFVHAQDRLWQMEFQRRVGAGRLAEIVGAGALPTDRFLRTLGLYRRAVASLAHLEPESVAWLEAYAAGVNAYLATRRGAPPPEFLLLRHDAVEPWTPADSLVWIRMMALDLGMNWRDELLRARLARRLTEAQIADIWPDTPDGTPITLAGLARELPFDRLAAALPPGPEPGQGSNAWVVDGRHSASGAPLLANDPHLGLRAPGVWYLAHLRAPDLELIGATLPGVPSVVLGHNGRIAWGFTNTGSDTQDLFIEQLDPADPGRYLTPDGTAPFEVREEVIAVKDGPPVMLRVRETRHGPVLSDLIPDADGTFGAGRVVALAWPGLAEDDTSLQALFKLGRAEDWAAFVAALRDVGAPQQNILYADVEGRIGFIAPGRVPVRRQGDGRWPVPGWSGAHDWLGWIPFDELPQAVDPPDGRFVNANNRIVPEDYPHLLTADWEPAYRARRIAELLDAAPLDVGDHGALQQDERSLLAVDLLPMMLEAVPASEEAAEALARLAAWDRVMAADAAEPLVFAAWYRELSRLIYADELGELFMAFWHVRPQFMDRVLRERTEWCNDIGTPEVEDCPTMAARALELALADLRARFGAPHLWRWGDAHPARMAHPILDEVPVLGRLFTIAPATGGDSATVNAGHYVIRDAARPFASVHAASYRGLYELAELDRSRFIAATGQSGNPLSVHYRDLTALWAAGEDLPMLRRAEQYGAGAIGRLRLVPE